MIITRFYALIISHSLIQYNEYTIALNMTFWFLITDI